MYNDRAIRFGLSRLERPVWPSLCGAVDRRLRIAQADVHRASDEEREAPVEAYSRRAPEIVEAGVSRIKQRIRVANGETNRIARAERSAVVVHGGASGLVATAVEIGALRASSDRRREEEPVGSAVDECAVQRAGVGIGYIARSAVSGAFKGRREVGAITIDHSGRVGLKNIAQGWRSNSQGEGSLNRGTSEARNTGAWNRKSDAVIVPACEVRNRIDDLLAFRNFIDADTVVSAIALISVIATAGVTKEVVSWIVVVVVVVRAGGAAVLRKQPHAENSVIARGTWVRIGAKLCTPVGDLSKVDVNHLNGDIGCGLVPHDDVRILYRAPVRTGAESRAFAKSLARDVLLSQVDVGVGDRGAEDAEPIASGIEQDIADSLALARVGGLARSTDGDGNKWFVRVAVLSGCAGIGDVDGDRRAARRIGNREGSRRGRARRIGCGTTTRVCAGGAAAVSTAASVERGGKNAKVYNAKTDRRLIGFHEHSFQKGFDPRAKLCRKWPSCDRPFRDGDFRCRRQRFLHGDGGCAPHPRQLETAKSGNP